MKKLAVRDRDALLLLNQAGESPLSIGVDLKLQYCIKTIIELNLRALDYEGSNGQTALHLAVIRRDVDILLMILKKKQTS
ncbi:hypothetical protein HRI_002097100 [Hibiscus trionum]|uniref:Uncharacterized protein n=1 Tax=Hibiscus trionum TaxID=183268 RepID=A0A9W7HX28_HIBTR|nr:hypothetical protein HRI_002097100 [Hibiscus trionum]